MAVVYIKDIVAPNDIKIAQEEYGSYIKIVVDVEREVMTIGGEWHADGEKILIEKGSEQSNVWGGGIETDLNNIETIALINLRTNINNSQEILDAKIRELFVKIIKDKFQL